MLTVLRIVAGLLFLEHGTQKLFEFPEGGRAAPVAMTLPWIAGILEFVLGGLITLGLFTRTAALIASGEMAVAYFIAHASKGFFPANNGGETAVLYCFLFLFLVFAGAGAWSLDGHRDVARSK